MKCPACGHQSSRVVDSRPGPDGVEIRRRRECDDCTHRFTTYERIEDSGKMVVKRDGRREPFDADKVRRSLRTACRKRPVSADIMERMVDRVAAMIDEGPERELASEALGRQLLKELAGVDEVSYARFASVYRRFNSLADFVSLANEAPDAPPTDGDDP